MITRDGIPVFAVVLKSSGFSFKARYVNDVHLPRFGGDCQIRSDHFCHCQSRSDRFCQSSNLYGTATRSQMHHGDSKDFSPSNAWNDSKSAVLRQLPRQPKLALGVGHAVPKRKFRTTFANTVRNHIITEMSIRYSAHCRGNASNWQPYI